jgi:hypothetical protein
MWLAIGYSPIECREFYMILTSVMCAHEGKYSKKFTVWLHKNLSSETKPILQETLRDWLE